MKTDEQITSLAYKALRILNEKIENAIKAKDADRLADIIKAIENLEDINI